MYRDSVGNTYTKLPSKKDSPSAKGAKPGPKHGSKGHQSQNCAKYRMRVGRPSGRGMTGGKPVPQRPNIEGKLGNIKPPNLPPVLGPKGS